MTSMAFEQATVCFPVTVQITKDSFIDEQLGDDAARRLSEFASDFVSFAGCLTNYCARRAAQTTDEA